MTNLPKDIFGVPVKNDVVHAALVWYLASQRRGTHSTLTKGEVSGGGKKPWKQKGTGRARAGSNRSPLWRKGGVIFGPKPRSYAYNLPKKVRRLAIKMVLSDKANDGKIKVVDGLKLTEPKTKLASKFLKELEVSGKVLVISGSDNKEFYRAARNLKGLKLAYFKELNVFDLLNAEWLVLEKSAVANLKEALA